MILCSRMLPYLFTISHARLRAKFNEEAKGEFKLSVNDFVIKAAALAMRKVPEVNSEWRGDVIRRYNNVDINIAVPTDRGLFTPLLRSAETRGLSEIATSVKALAGRAKEGKSPLEELATGSFTISNLGMFGIQQFSAVINPPQACILAVGGSEQKVVVNPKFGKEGEPEFKATTVMKVTLSCDHRVVDGAVGAQWLQTFKGLIENPVNMLL